MKSMFKRLLNVEDMVVGDVSLDDSPLRGAPVLVARVRCGKGASRCSRCGRKAPRYDNGGAGEAGGIRASVASASGFPALSRGWNAVRAAWWSPGCRGPGRAAGSPAASDPGAHG